MSEKIRTVIDAQYEGFCKDCFAHWITCLWGKYADGFTFDENKEAFFYLLERLLMEGKIKFENPFGYEPPFWEASPEAIIQHLKMGWPTTAQTEGDSAIVDFFYQDERVCPPIAWLGPDGKWHGS